MDRFDAENGAGRWVPPVTPRWVVGLAAGLVAVLLVVAIATHQAGVALLSQLHACGNTGAVDGTHEPQAPAGAAALSVRVATWNVRYTNTAANIVAGIRAIGAQADVVGLQELNTPAKRRTVAKTLTAEWAMTGGPPRNAVPIIWRRSVFELIGTGSQLASGVARVEPGADGRVSNLRYMSWVRLRQRDAGGVVVVINTHLTPTIDRAGHPDRSRPDRLRVYDQEMSRLLQLVDTLKAAGPVVATMDGNIDARADARIHDPRWPQARMGRHGMSSNWRVLGFRTAAPTKDA